MSDDLGDRMKMYEIHSTSRRAFKGQPLVVRLDGKSFHTFTKGLARPFDQRLSELMVQTTAALIERFNPLVGYTQSDEITLIFVSKPEDPGELIFDGRYQKIESLTASFAGVFFKSQLPTSIPEKADELPIFDSRAFVVPNLQEAYHSLLWRQLDATKNAVSMAAQSMFPHSELQNKSGPEMQEMMFQHHGVNFNDYPPFFKRGTFVKRFRRLVEMTTDQLETIPEQHRPEGPITRSKIEPFDIWLNKRPDAMSILFGYGGGRNDSNFQQVV